MIMRGPLIEVKAKFTWKQWVPLKLEAVFCTVPSSVISLVYGLKHKNGMVSSLLIENWTKLEILTECKSTVVR